MFRTPNTPKPTCTLCRRPSRGASRCPPTPQLGTVLQPASQVPESCHSGLNGTNGNRHPGSSVLSPTSLSANPSLHSSLRLNDNVPEKVNVKTKKTKDKIKTIFGFLV